MGATQLAWIDRLPTVSQPWTVHSLDVTSALQGIGQLFVAVELYGAVYQDTRNGAFASSHTAAILGWDNVQLIVTTPDAPTPEPEPLGITGAGLVS